MSASGDIDPARVNIERLKRRRVNRRKAPPPANAKSGEAEAIARLDALPFNPGLMLEPNGDEWSVTSPHSDEELWQVQIATAFGTRSMALVETFAGQLRDLCPDDWDEDLQRWKPNETEWNALLAMVADHRPENAAQAALAAQMAATHLMQMRLSKDALNRGGMVLERSASLASKLARTFATQCETMLLLKGKKLPSRQTIKVVKEVRQYVQYNDNRAGGRGEIPHQSDAPLDRGVIRNESAGRIADLREMPGEAEAGRVVPISRRSRP